MTEIKSGAGVLPGGSSFSTEISALPCRIIASDRGIGVADMTKR